MRVLLVTPDYPPTHGGIQRLLHNITAAMEDAEVRVVTMRSPGWADFDATGPNEVTRVRAAPGSQTLRNGVFNLSAILATPSWRPDVILNGHVVTGPAAYLLARRFKAANVLYTYGKEVQGRPGMTSWTLKHSTSAVAVSEYTRQQVLNVANGRSAVPLTVVHPGVYVPPEAGRADANVPTIVTTARLRDWYKGHDVMLDAMRIVVRAVPAAQWVVIGDGRIRGDLESRAVDYGLAEHVLFLGAARDEVRDGWLDRAHVFAMPARYPRHEVGGEGFPVVYLEAAARALPTVAGDVGGPTEAVVDGETGLLVDAESAEAVAAALVTLLRDKAYARRLGSAGRVRASRSFTWQAVGAELRAALATAIAQSRR